MGTYSVASETNGIANALFTKVQQRVLAIFFGNPSRSFHLNELIQLASSGSGAVQREVRKLAAAELISMTRVGNMTRYQANASSPVYHELRGIIEKTSGVVDVLRRTLAEYSSGIQAAFIFGSTAKHTDTAQSDIDVMIVGDEISYGTLFGALEPAAQKLGRTVNPTIYSRQEFDERQREGHHFVRKVMEQPKLWIIGSEDELIP